MTRLIRRSSLHVLLVAWTLVALVPFVLIVVSAFRDNDGLSRFPFGIGGDYYPENFVSAFVGPPGSVGMGVFLLNSAVAALTSILVNVVAGAAGAYFITGLSRRAQDRAINLVLLGTVVPFVLLLVPYFRVYQMLGLVNQPWAVGLAYGALGLPTTILVLHAFFSDFPGEIREAAQIDGASPIGTFVRIVVPLSSGPLLSVALVQLIWVWNETLLAIVLLQKSSSLTVPVGLLGFQRMFSVDYGPIFAGLTLALIPVLVLYLLFHRAITSGLSLGGSLR